jgi:hypothetical protein
LTPARSFRDEKSGRDNAIAHLGLAAHTDADQAVSVPAVTLP